MAAKLPPMGPAHQPGRGAPPSLARELEEGQGKMDSVSTRVSEFLRNWELRQLVWVGFLLVIYRSPSWTPEQS